MLDSLPPSMNEGIGRYILRTLELLAAMSLACVVVAVGCGVLAYRSAGRSRIAWTWIAVVMGLLALAPPGFVLYVTSH